MHDPNMPLLELAAEKLHAFLDQVVFVGGATLGLHITNPASAPIEHNRCRWNDDRVPIIQQRLAAIAQGKK